MKMDSTDFIDFISAVTCPLRLASNACETLFDSKASKVARVASGIGLIIGLAGIFGLIWALGGFIIPESVSKPEEPKTAIVSPTEQVFALTEMASQKAQEYLNDTPESAQKRKELQTQIESLKRTAVKGAKVLRSVTEKSENSSDEYLYDPTPSGSTAQDADWEKFVQKNKSTLKIEESTQVAASQPDVNKSAKTVEIYAGKVAEKAGEYLSNTPEGAQKRAKLQRKLKKVGNFLKKIKNQETNQVDIEK